MTDAAAADSLPSGPGSVQGSPQLPEGFTSTFTSTFVQLPDLRLHVVRGGSGPPLLLLGGWPQTWYQWRLVMPELAKHFSLIVVDPRGVGLSSKPRTGYDVGTLAKDQVQLMKQLGHARFCLLSHDVGLWVGYALASDHPECLERLVVCDAIAPGVAPSPPLLGPQALANRLFHFAFNRLHEVNERLVEGREDIFFGHQFASKAARPDSIPPHAVQLYVDALRQPDALRASFDYYRAIDDDMKQNAERKQKPKLQLPVMAVGGDKSGGEGTADNMRIVCENVTGVVLPACGHYVPEEAPEALLKAVLGFLEPYRAAASA